MNSYCSDFEKIFERINIVHLTEKNISPILQELFLSRKVSEIADQGFDVHLNYSTLRSGYTAAKKINTVYDIADDLGAMIRSSPQIPKLLRPFGNKLGNFFIKKNIHISKAVAVTTDTLLKTYNIPINKLKLIPNGVDTEHFHDRGNRKREELNINGFLIGYVGVLREWVDMRPIFIALSRLDKNIKMLIVGQEGRFKENVYLAKQYGVDDRVLFAGMVPYSEVPEYISAMDACVIPFKPGAISENALPLKLFEYMACNKPVISTTIPGVKNAAGENVMYADSIDDYGRQILKLYKNENLRSSMGQSGRDLVVSCYDWAGIAERLEKLLLKASLEN